MGVLDNNVALVTGAARGSGAAIAERFVAEGAKVILADVLDERGAELAASLGASASYTHLDISVEDDWATAVAAIREEHGGLHVLVNNAAILHLSMIEVTATDTFRRVMDVNAMGTFLGVRACLPLMRDGGGGAIVNIGSIDSVQGTPATVAYTASKFAVLGLTKVAAIELGRYGIRVNCVCPAAGSDEMMDDAIIVPEPSGGNGSSPANGTATFDSGFSGDDPFWPQPIPRRGYPHDMVGATLFFASSDSAFCTGASLLVDGGHTAGHYISVPGVFTA